LERLHKGYKTKYPCGASMTDEDYSAPASEIEMLKSGTYMNCYCPHCQQTFNEGDTAIFGVVNQEGKRGRVNLSPYLNVFKRESTIYLPEEQEASDLFCTHCGKSLVVSDERCELCNGRVARILTNALTRTVPFYICMKVGCHWHGLSEKDEKLIDLDDSNEW